MTIRWGLCCQFCDSPIRFRQATHRYVSSLDASRARAYLSDIARANAIALAHAVERCAELGIGAFRITSQIIPLATHPQSGFTLAELLDGHVIADSFRAAGRIARERGVRLSFHPDQFVVLNSEREHVVASSLAELELQSGIADLVGADTICLHAGGASGGRDQALQRLRRGLDRLSLAARTRLALENDDRTFTVQDLLPLCREEGLPLVYDVHHHRVNGDDLSLADATELAGTTWRNREQWVHISSPKDGWQAANVRSHADYIDPDDFPSAWQTRTLTVDVEAKAKEQAVLALRESLKTLTGRNPASGRHRASARPFATRRRAR